MKIKSFHPVILLLSFTLAFNFIYLIVTYIRYGYNFK